ncbi:response regulator transcription factor [Microbulbifer pacificus]|uniref:response regulator transcription factor n=1 Tax=Microbulbifer pacificus TaxID=407164 RepID=UPI000CF562D4|nr:response regulator transcription factor [Microbulbifer pacificus]
MTFVFNKKLRVAVLDDHPLMCQAISARLDREVDFDVCGVFDSSKELFSSISENCPDLLILDYMLSKDELDGLALIKRLHIRFPLMKLLISSSAEDSVTVRLAIKAGASGFVGKSQSPDELVAAVRKLWKGNVYIPPWAVDANSQSSLAGNEGENLLRLNDLSPRELEVLRCYVSGMTVTEIAKKYSRSCKTISTQKQSALNKLGIRSEAELFKFSHLITSR